MLRLSKKKIEELRLLDPEDAGAEIARLYEQHKAKRREWRAANKEKAYASQVKWKKKNRKKHLAARARERANINADPARRAYRAKYRKEWGEKTGFQSKPRSVEGNRAAARLRYWRVKTKTMAQEKPNDLKAAIRPLVPGYLQPSAKMDVIAAVVELALQNKVAFNKLKDAVKKCVAAYNRQFDQFKNVSIDAPIAGTDGLTRADLLDSETFHF
ncbi:hypothetical protein [Brucella pseudogrignonensis]|uniref:Outer membrane murein-binding lipoprotein Lpp n=1 Tax=Brucella pseudogrignonensis TaxID=419475 RepID=A0ABU1M5G6_9HYPH|nr:hypothetical protein [Brucella pseudogrignonensis]MDR6431284.1 outer membrane murein-binding lipoprotein Lpp [Brucella pseudogrignonensis]